MFILLHNLHQGNNTSILDSLAAFSKSVDGTVPCTALRNAFVARHSSLEFHILFELYIDNNKLDGPRICANVWLISEKHFQLCESTNYTEKANRSNFHKSQDILIGKRVFSTMIKEFKDKTSVNEDNAVFLIAWIKVSRILHIGTWDPLI
ncbi:hypothetical protein GQX74_006909 [Glossina fuscipes]|nr:hypothetical protein GQX74_006909 [Glossina fuscipes]